MHYIPQLEDFTPNSPSPLPNMNKAWRMQRCKIFPISMEHIYVQVTIIMAIICYLHVTRPGTIHAVSLYFPTVIKVDTYNLK